LRDLPRTQYSTKVLVLVERAAETARRLGFSVRV